MKIHVLSDLHIEFADFKLPETDADVIVLAGDIGVGLGGLYWIHAQRRDKPIIYVPGNHEYYTHDINLTSIIREMAADNVHVLNNDQVIIDGVRFLGATLWTDFALLGESDKYFAVHNAKDNMSDFYLIQDGEKAFTPLSSIALHNESREWLDIMMAEKEGFEKTVVVTHHCTSEQSCHPRFAGSILNPAFASNLEWMMGDDRADLWIHGHTHDAYDYNVLGTRVVCNPRGYPREPSEFEADKVVEV